MKNLGGGYGSGPGGGHPVMAVLSGVVKLLEMMTQADQAEIKYHMQEVERIQARLGELMDEVDDLRQLLVKLMADLPRLEAQARYQSAVAETAFVRRIVRSPGGWKSSIVQSFLCSCKNPVALQLVLWTISDSLRYFRRQAGQPEVPNEPEQRNREEWQSDFVGFKGVEANRARSILGAGPTGGIDSHQFGPGFYVSTDLYTAQRFAGRDGVVLAVFCRDFRNTTGITVDVPRNSMYQVPLPPGAENYDWIGGDHYIVNTNLDGTHHSKQIKFNRRCYHRISCFPLPEARHLGYIPAPW